MKLKNKVIGTIFGVIASSFVFISVPEVANASGCSAEDPCGTWAVIVNDRVVNTIVCQPSVCGSGVFNGQKVVLQVPANPVTHQYQGGHFSMEHDRIVTYNEEQKTFSQQESLYKDGAVVGSQVVTWSAPQVNTEVVPATEVTDEATITATINPDGSKYNNSATISATENTLVETKFFDQPVTKQQLEVSVQESTILKRYANKFAQLLKGWLIA